MPLSSGEAAPQRYTRSAPSTTPWGAVPTRRSMCRRRGRPNDRRQANEHDDDADHPLKVGHAVPYGRTAHDREVPVRLGAERSYGRLVAFPLFGRPRPSRHRKLVSRWGYTSRRSRLPRRPARRPPREMPRSFDRISISASMALCSSDASSPARRSLRNASRSAIHRSPSMMRRCTNRAYVPLLVGLALRPADRYRRLDRIPDACDRRKGRAAIATTRCGILNR